MFDQNNPNASWLFNVQDKYKPLSQEEIIQDLNKNKLPCAVLMTQLNGDFNFGSVIRSCNALNLTEVFYYGRKKYDARSACGTYKYTNVTFLPEFADIIELKKQYSFVALENNIDRNPQNIIHFKWPSKPLIILGEESKGLQSDILDLCDHFVEIPIRGSVRSYNAAVAASIALYDFYLKSQL